MAKIEIRWPSGVHQILENVKSDQNLRVDEPAKNTAINRHRALDANLAFLAADMP